MKSTGSPAGSTRWSGPLSALKRPSNSWKHSPESSGAINTHRTHQSSTTLAPEQAWRKSSYSDGTGNNCIETAKLSKDIAVRDSKDKQRPALLFPQSSWTAFVASVRDGDIFIDPRP
ncbi:DUF397 domain-containing protein [Streptomyces sp. NPDC057798]|uniref:DUF397 domain-containing protein n=1 Tax=Streptomyces sp. NPDC057798 TaxID=3346252 RepID=UPI0036AFD2B7